jgi:hypothetical protein
MFAARRVQHDRRESEREEVFYRTRAVANGFGSLPVQVVNISANGFMARSETELPIGHPLTIRLPIVGEIKAEVRWALGGRIGCQFVRMIDFAPYLELLGALAREGR